MFDGIQLTSFILKGKKHNLYKVVNNFTVSNERLIRVNHVFQYLIDSLDVIGKNDCQVYDY